MYVEPRDMACRLQLRTSFADEEVNMNVDRHNNRRENTLLVRKNGLCDTIERCIRIQIYVLTYISCVALLA